MGLAGNRFLRTRRSFSFKLVARFSLCFLRDKLAEDFQVDAATFGPAAVALAYNVRAKSEVDPLMKRAASVGATILKSAREASWGGYSVYFADPDGFAWEIAWNPQWRLA